MSVYTLFTKESLCTFGTYTKNQIYVNMRTLVLYAAILLSTFCVDAKAINPSVQEGAQTNLVATPLESHVMLSWTTTASGVEVYELERSKNGIDYTTISRVEPGSINIEFIETDFTPMDGMSFYRIKAIDAQGNITFSNPAPVKYKAGTPVSPTLGNVAAKDNQEPVLVVVRNNNGEEYYSKVEVSSDSEPMLVRDLEEHLAAGTYTVVSSSVQEYYSRKIIVK